MKSKLFLLLLLFPAALFASQKTEKFPSQCDISGFHISHKSIAFFSLHKVMPRLYIIHNVSKKPIWLTHERKNNPGAGAGWASQLGPQHWSAILVTRRDFDLHCHFQNKAGAMKRISCDHVIRACQFSQFHSKNSISGGYWVAENLALPVLMSRIQARGFSHIP